MYLTQFSLLVMLPWTALPHYQWFYGHLEDVSRDLHQRNYTLFDQDPIHTEAFHFDGFYGLHYKYYLYFNIFQIMYCVLQIG